MADKLDDLLASIQQHIKDKKGELKALETQVYALRSAHDDINQEVHKAQDRLQDARDLLVESDNELARKRDEAQRIANDILRAAHASRAQTEAGIKTALEAASRDVIDSERRLKVIEGAIASKKGELQAATDLANAKHSELEALKAKARKFADG